ncbi:expressed unknown protein [Seminavis robusta]|uniref:Uncharacterized protein n=1 Tax=Seminavis robusta TaxID=568900 RepID=A0A9N8HA46_9STRA|nr:expressed unknown protein [Seminavis robusta]|eukprot:Sro279_g106850.1 n/a (313) ;mRNA; r:52341-53279
MVILGEPFGSFVCVGRDTVNTESLILPCFQPLTIYSVFVLTVAVRTLFLSIMVLNNPFEYQSEQISVDHLLASSERSIFFHLRANFGRSVSSQATGKYGTTTDDDETSHTARESIASFAEETRHSMAMKRWQEPSSHHHRGSSHHHRDSDRTQKSQSNVSFANDLVFSNSSHDPKGTRPSDASFGLEELARMQNSKVSFADVLVEEMTPLTSKADNDGNRSHAATFMTKGPGVKGFLRSLSDGSRGSGKTFRTVSKHASNSSTDLDAAGPRSILRRSWTSGSSSLTFPLPDTELEHDEPSVTSFVSSSSGTW